MPNHIHGIIHIVRGAGRGFDQSASRIHPQRPEITIRTGAGEGYDYASPGISTQHPYNGEDIVPDGDEGVILSSLGVIVRAFKASVSYRIIAMREVTKPLVWQRNYYDHIIRNAREYEKIWDYIDTNPATWVDDKLNPSVKSR
jgi:putative transposase